MKRTCLFLLSLLLIAAISGCGESPNGNENGYTIEGTIHQCISEPDIHIAVVSEVGDKICCNIHTPNGAGQYIYNRSDLIDMLSDGHWKDVTNDNPNLGPPPPTLGTSYTDRPDVHGTRLNGSALVQVHVVVPVPKHRAIQVSPNTNTE